MTKLDTLIDRAEGISLGESGGGNLFHYLQEFFSRKDVQEKMIELNQKMLFYEGKGSNGQPIGTYKRATARLKRKVGLPDQEYTFYETGSFYASMGVDPKADEVTFTSSEDGLGIDKIGHWGPPTPIRMEHIKYMRGMYDPQGNSLGLSDDKIDIFVNDEELDIRGQLIKNLNEYLNGTDTD